MATLTCSLNVTIPSDMIIIWSHNSSVVRTDGVSRAGKSTTLVIENFKPSDAGDYECQFYKAINNGWTLIRNIRLSDCRCVLVWMKVYTHVASYG